MGTTAVHKVLGLRLCVVIASMGCGNTKRGDVVVPVTKHAASTVQTPSKPSQVPVRPTKSKKVDDPKPIEFREDPALTEEERQARREKMAQLAEQRLKQGNQKGITKEGSVEFGYMVKHQQDLEKYRKLDDGKNLDWVGS